MNKEINLDFIPKDLDGNPLTSETLSKEVVRKLCEASDTEYCLEKYMLGKELFETGKATFVDAETDATKALIEYFKKFCQEYGGYSNQIKGQILLKF